MDNTKFDYNLSKDFSLEITFCEKKIAGKYYIEEQVGTGGHSIVFKVRDKDDKNYAMKLFFKDSESEVKKELDLLKSISEKGNEKFFTTLIDSGNTKINKKKICRKTSEIKYTRTDDVTFLITILADDDLVSFVCKNKDSITFNQKIAMSLNLVNALSKLHTKDLIHRDIKPENVLQVGESLILSDFGLSIDSKSAKSKIRIEGPKYWPSPEYLNPCKDQAIATKSTDVFHLACILQYLFTGIYPLGFWNESNIFDSEADLSKEMKKKKRLIKALIETALHYDIDYRFEDGIEFYNNFEKIIAS